MNNKINLRLKIDLGRKYLSLTYGWVLLVVRIPYMIVYLKAPPQHQFPKKVVMEKKVYSTYSSRHNQGENNLEISFRLLQFLTLPFSTRRNFFISELGIPL